MRQNSLLFFLIMVFLTACSSRENLDQSAHFFDLRGYFDKEAQRLQTTNPLIEKTVSQKNDSEKKQLRLSNWKTELELFTESDINKPSWKDSYHIIKKGYTTQYLAKDPDLRTQKIFIKRVDNNSIKQISIVNQSSNALYTSAEQLDYFPDSLYSIRKEQNVKVIGLKSYSISARFKN